MISLLFCNFVFINMTAEKEKLDILHKSLIDRLNLIINLIMSFCVVITCGL